MKKNNNNLVIILMGVIIVILAVLCVLFATETIKFDKNESDIKTEPNIDVEDYVAKIDNSKDWVYDATYKYDNKYTEFKRFSSEDDEKRVISYYGIDVESREGMQYLNDLKVPFLNFKSNDAIKVNNELNKLYNKYASEFDKCAEESKNDSEPSCSQILTYRIYKSNKILSVVVIDSIQATSPWILNYNIYNFDLKDGSLISYDGLLSKLGYNKESVLDKMESLIKEKMDNIFENTVIPEKDLSKACVYSKDDNGNFKYGSTNCYDITYKLFEESIFNNKVLYFSDNDGVLNILPILYADFVQNGDANHYLIKINK